MYEVKFLQYSCTINNEASTCQEKKTSRKVIGFWSLDRSITKHCSRAMTHARHNEKGKSKLQGDSYKSVENIRENLWLSNNHRVMTLVIFGRNILTEKLCNFCGVLRALVAKAKFCQRTKRCWD